MPELRTVTRVVATGRVPPVARAAALVVVLAATGCASTPPGATPDPLQPVNRAIFGFNVFVDDHAIGPAARGYKRITPDRFRRSVSNFFYNVDFPERFVSSLGQAEGGKAATEVARFTVNTTVGLAGFFDPATYFGLGKYDEDLGQMMGRWGIPPGPYWVIPLLGPSNPRDTVGLVASRFLNPFFWLDYFVTDYVALGTGVFQVFNFRAQADEQIATARRSALDYYVFVRDAFVARRAAQIRNEEPPDPDASEQQEDDLYDDLYDDPDSPADAAGEDAGDAEDP